MVITHNNSIPWLEHADTLFEDAPKLAQSVFLFFLKKLNNILSFPLMQYNYQY